MHASVNRGLYRLETCESLPKHPLVRFTDETFKARLAQPRMASHPQFNVKEKEWS